jgi:hypothetical protein
MSDSDNSDFTTGSPDEPFHVARVAFENHGFSAKSRGHHDGINHIPVLVKPGNRPILKRTVIVKSDPLLHQTKFDLA